MSDYQKLLQQALTEHENAQQSVRGQLNTKRVSDAVGSFAEPFAALNVAIAKAKSGPGGSANDDVIRDALRLLDSQRGVLQSVIDRAEKDDDLTVKGVVVQQASARALADKQKVADQQFMAKVDKVLGLAREDAAQKGGGVKPEPSPVVPPQIRLSGRAYPPK
jgi:hypothetical protein